MADDQLSVRDKLQRDRLEKVRKMGGVARVRVLPRDDDVRKFITHQPSLIGFPESGSVEWPNDSFTQRRIADGSVTLETPETPDQKDQSPKDQSGTVVSGSGDAGGSS